MRFAKLWVNLSALACALACTSASFAIPIVNPSFEILGGALQPNRCGTDCSFTDGGTPVPGWTATPLPGMGSAATGQFQPGPPATTTYFDSVPDGITIAYSNGGTLSQAVGAVEVGVLYTLIVDQGLRKDDIPDPGIVELLIGNNAPILATTEDPLVKGGWQTFTATYTGLAGDVGKPITIALVSGGAQADWDNVRLNAAGTIPEPSSILLIGVAVVALAGVARRSHLGHARG